jgi:hypothetical protein
MSCSAGALFHAGSRAPSGLDIERGECPASLFGSVTCRREVMESPRPGFSRIPWVMCGSPRNFRAEPHRIWLAHFQLMRQSARAT